MITEYLIKFDEEIKSCDVCPFCKTNDDLDSEDYRHMYCGYPQMGEFVTDYIACRHPDCPIKEVPSHGVLWDRDKVFNVFDERIQMYRELGYKDDDFVIQELGHTQADLIAKVETVIEASTPFARFCNTEGCSNTKPDMSKAQNHICPYYQGVCSLDENMLCYCEHHYEMCEKFIKVIKGREK